jgi:hypothetical protein
VKYIYYILLTPSPAFLSFFLFFFFVLLGFQLCLTLATQLLYYLGHSTSPFCVDYFGIKILVYNQAALDHDPLLVFSCIAGMTGTSHCTWPLVEIGGSYEHFAQAGLEL